MKNSHVSQTQTATTDHQSLEADFERTMPKTGSIQRWAIETYHALQRSSHETGVKHQLETWLIQKVAERHPNRKIGAINWFIELSCPKEGLLEPWANESYRIIVYGGICDDPTQQELLLKELRGRLHFYIGEKRTRDWFAGKQLPRRPARPTGERQLIRTTMPPQQRHKKERTQPVTKHHTKPPVFTETDYQPNETEIAERIIQLQDQMREVGIPWDDADLFDTARRQIIAEHKQNVAA